LSITNLHTIFYSALTSSVNYFSKNLVADMNRINKTTSFTGGRQAGDRIWNIKLSKLLNLASKTSILRSLLSICRQPLIKRTNSRKDYRSGYYKRNLLTTYGLISETKVSKARNKIPV
jgi:hypothetical protein